MTCPYCGHRDRVSEDACASCAAPVGDITEPMTFEMRVFRFIERRPGATHEDVMIALDMGESESNYVAVTLRRLAKRGALRSWRTKTITRQYQTGLEMSYAAIRWVDGGKKEAA